MVAELTDMRAALADLAVLCEHYYEELADRKRRPRDEVPPSLARARAALATPPDSGRIEAEQRVIEAARRRRDAYVAYERVCEAQGPFSLPPEAEWQAYLEAVRDEDVALDALAAEFAPAATGASEAERRVIRAAIAYCQEEEGSELIPIFYGDLEAAVDDLGRQRRADIDAATPAPEPGEGG